MRNKTFEMTGGHSRKGNNVSPKICVAYLHTDMLEDNPGTFPPDQHYEKITDILRSMLGNLFLGHPLWQVSSGSFWASNQQTEGGHAAMTGH